MPRLLAQIFMLVQQGAASRSSPKAAKLLGLGVQGLGIMGFMGFMGFRV